MKIRHIGTPSPRRRAAFLRGRGLRAGLLLATLPSAAALIAATPPGPAQASTTPYVTYAYYMSATTASGLNTQAYNDGYAFARSLTGGQTAYLILDFGEVVDSGGTFGACDFSPSCTGFLNPQILTALENASSGVHAGYTSGKIIITYGVSNDNVNLSYSQNVQAGEYQEQRAADLASYESGQGRIDQGAAAAADMEPDYNTFAKTKGLVDGAGDSGDFYAYIDYGSADGCPTSGSSGNCDNGWTVADEAYVSYTGNYPSVVMPEVYSVAASAQADQWTVIRKNGGGGYTFAGVSVDSASDARSLWNDLNSLNSGLVGAQTAVF
jgi:hypothetical protein